MPISVIAVDTLSSEWELKYHPGAEFNTYNHPPSQSPAAHHSHRRLPFEAQNTAQNLLSAGKSRIVLSVIIKMLN